MIKLLCFNIPLINPEYQNTFNSLIFKACSKPSMNFIQGSKNVAKNLAKQITNIIIIQNKIGI